MAYCFKLCSELAISINEVNADTINKRANKILEFETYHPLHVIVEIPVNERPINLIYVQSAIKQINGLSGLN